MPRAAVLAVTAAAQGVELQRALDAGMDGHLTKPIRLEALRDALLTWRPQQPTACDEGGVPVPSAHDEPPGGSSAAEPARAAIDLAVLRGFVGDDAATIAVLLRHFDTELHDIARAIDQSCEATDWHGVGALAHKLKSSARTVGALDLGDRCAELEAAARADDAGAARVAYAGFRQERVRVAGALEKTLEGAPC